MLASSTRCLRLFGLSIAPLSQGNTPCLYDCSELEAERGDKGSGDMAELLDLSPGRTIPNR